MPIKRYIRLSVTEEAYHELQRIMNHPDIDSECKKSWSSLIISMCQELLPAEKSENPETLNSLQISSNRVEDAEPTPEQEEPNDEMSIL